MAGAAGVEAVLLDLGNVLVPIDFGRVFAHWGRVDGVAVDDLRARWSWDERYHAYERGHIDEATYFAHLRARLGLRQPDADMLAGWNAVFLEPHPEAAGLVEELSRRYPLYLFSNTNRAHQAWFTPQLEPMLERFTEVFTSCDIGLRKPDPQAFLHVAERMRVAPGRIAFFDDMAENVEGARRAGLQAFQVTRGPEDVRRVLP
jgi:HAD superfamily hydrolase (TIGR01509 family)